MADSASKGADSRIDHRFGIDIGAVFAKIVALDDSGAVKFQTSRRHNGNPVEVVKEELIKSGLDGSVAAAVTGANAELLAERLKASPVDYVQAEISAVKSVYPGVRNIINVGGASVTLIQLDEEGNFLDYSTNSLCAAGTGSFLDQQADRLGIEYEDLASFSHIDDPPPIATRCSVFAKTDLIHRQQEGYSKDALWCGLCKGMTGTFLNTLLRGRPLKGLTVITGGVSLNDEVIRWLKEKYGEQIQTYERSEYSGAFGAARLAVEKIDDFSTAARELHYQEKKETQSIKRKPLRFVKSKYPSFDVAESYADEYDNEIRITHWPESCALDVYVGIDVGSTSTKVLLIDAQGEATADIYRRTAGDPIEATKHLFSAISEISERKNTQLTILGAGTTGSGRKLVGQVIGADIIINEITAHLTGAVQVDPGVDTIFEIGGQDSKYIRSRHGRIYDSNMNYVCAAGTGSFVEEQAKKLGFSLSEIGDIVMGIAPPVTSDRCTVFMEQDVDRLIRQGYTREECTAAVLYSVVKNYLNKVVGKRFVSKEKIFFQGATARNKGLVAAFENLLDVEMVVSPYCHVMGSYGVALLIKHKMAAERAETKFKGLDLSRREIKLHSETCELCQNHCKITYAEIEGDTERPSWGYMCGRDRDESKMRVNEQFAAFRRRQRMVFSSGASRASSDVQDDRTPQLVEGGARASSDVQKHAIGIPRSLTNYSFLPLWRTFFEELGCRVILSSPTDDEKIKKGTELTAADFCFPVKIAHGHAYQLAEAEDVDFLFLPHTISPEENPKTTNTFFCPYVQTQPSIIKSALSMHRVEVDRILNPIVDYRWEDKKQIAHFHEIFGAPLRVTKAQISKAWNAAKEAHSEFRAACREEGVRLLEELDRTGSKAIVVMGRPYNTLDLGSNLGLPQKIAELGLTVIPMDMLPYDVNEISDVFENMYWSYGQNIACAAELVKGNDSLFGIYFTNFCCGPDSFLLEFVEEIMGDKPFLILEIDEHGGDAGYMTRVEAFFDVVRSWDNKHERFNCFIPESGADEFRRRKMWIPPMHPIASRIFASAMNSYGYNAEALSTEDHDTFELGRSLTRGSECLPAAVTIGGFVTKLREIDADPKEHAFFMPAANGPCRFGQYKLLHRMILNHLGYEDVPILSPSCYNAYQGLDQGLRRLLWKAILASDILFKCACKVRPYEMEGGQTNRVLEEETQRTEEAFEKGLDLAEVLRASVGSFSEIPASGVGSKPLVGVVGEIYVRCNPFTNDNVVANIERLGGEAWLTAASEWILYTAFIQQWNANQRALNFYKKFKAWSKNKFLLKYEHLFNEIADDLLSDRREPTIEEIIAEGEKYVPRNFYGESILTLGRASLFAQRGVKMVVNVAPFSCMPGTLTSALCQKIQADTNAPIVSMFYDGEEGLNQRLEVFLNNLSK